MSTMVVIRCPETDQEVPIGILMDLHTFALLPERNVRLQCPACGSVTPGRRRMRICPSRTMARQPGIGERGCGLWLPTS